MVAARLCDEVSGQAFMRHVTHRIGTEQAHLQSGDCNSATDRAAGRRAGQRRTSARDGKQVTRDARKREVRWWRRLAAGRPLWGERAGECQI